MLEVIVLFLKKRVKVRKFEEEIEEDHYEGTCIVDYEKYLKLRKIRDQASTECEAHVDNKSDCVSHSVTSVCFSTCRLYLM